MPARLKAEPGGARSAFNLSLEYEVSHEYEAADRRQRGTTSVARIRCETGNNPLNLRWIHQLTIGEQRRFNMAECRSTVRSTGFPHVRVRL